MSINNSLKNIYTSYWLELSTELLPLTNKERNRPSNPLLLQVDEKKYLNSDLKVMIFGQETNGWDKVYHGDIERLFKVYNDFFLKDYCYSYSGQFWNGVAAFKKFFEKSYPNTKIILIWNNITKIGLAEKKGKPTSDISKIEHDFFPVIKSEIEILKPDIVIFFTGPYRDKLIEHNLNDAKFLKTETSFSKWQLAQLVSKYLPEKSFRTYHPNYLWRNDFNKYKKTVFDLIENC